MPKPRQPLARAFITGDAIKNPKRYRGRSNPTVVPLGRPSPHLDATARLCFEAFKRELPWLAESDRALVECAADLRSVLLDGYFCLQTINALRLCLSAMGATPGDRTKIAVPDGPAPDPSQMWDA
jgi:hypothetical protein